MKIIIQNQEFGYDLGCALLKSKYKDTPFHGLEDRWDDIVPATFKQILNDGNVRNVEQRRVAFTCIGTESFLEEVSAELLNTDSIGKTATWVNRDGVLETKAFVDFYNLYKVCAAVWAGGLYNSTRDTEDLYFIKFKDTSTDREYILWIDPRSVALINGEWIDRCDTFDALIHARKLSAIDCIAWTIQTTVPQGQIKKIIRQGDCILVRPIEEYQDKENAQWRSLSGEEYRQYLSAES